MRRAGGRLGGLVGRGDAEKFVPDPPVRDVGGDFEELVDGVHLLDNKVSDGRR